MFAAQEPGGSPCHSTEMSKSPTLSSLSESGAVLVEVCCLLVLAVDNKVSFTHLKGTYYACFFLTLPFVYNKAFCASRCYKVHAKGSESLQQKTLV